MANEVYYHFPQTPGQSRRTGARGGKATARNRRQRLQGAAAEVLDSEAEATVQHPLVTTAADIALLDLQCPWLGGVERRASRTARKARAVATVRYTAAHP